MIKKVWDPSRYPAGFAPKYFSTKIFMNHDVNLRMERSRGSESCLFLWIVLPLFLLIASCASDESPDSEYSSSTALDERLTDKELIARRHCAGCHIYPEPDLLDKNTWLTQTLPAMGPHLGIIEYDGEEYPLDETEYLPENFYPDYAVATDEEWQSILDFYEEMAPERLERDDDFTDIRRENHIFEPFRPPYRSDTHPMASAVKIDPANGLIFLADANLGRMLIYNRNLDIVDTFEVPAAISHIAFTNNPSEEGRRGLMITYIANINPSDAKDGFISRGWYDPDSGRGEFDDRFIENLARPVEALLADLNQNGELDLLVSEFGHREGSVFWLKGEGDGNFNQQKNTLINTPGCLDSEIVDWTGNGLPDILVLCSQVDQAIYLFENRGNGEFSRTTLLRFPITAGSSSFEVHDFNGNGRLDILYTSGDNADYSMVYKPYHGVYIYTNDGEGQFTESWFYPINGAYSAKARDFSGDGSLDIAVTSFFADYARKPQEGFIFLQNSGNLAFTPYHPPEASYGRWIAMDTADWTGNGKDDIVLANFSLGPTKVHEQVEAILTQSPHLLVLRNLSASSN